MAKWISAGIGHLFQRPTCFEEKKTLGSVSDGIEFILTDLFPFRSNENTLSLSHGNLYTVYIIYRGYKFQ